MNNTISSIRMSKSIELNYPQTESKLYKKSARQKFRRKNICCTLVQEYVNVSLHFLEKLFLRGLPLNAFNDMYEKILNVQTKLIKNDLLLSDLIFVSH